MSHRQNINQKNEKRQATHLRSASHRIKKAKPQDRIKSLEAEKAANEINMASLKETNDVLRKGNEALKEKSENLLRCAIEARIILNNTEHLPVRKFFVGNKKRMTKEFVEVATKNWREKFKEFLQ